MAKNIGFLLCIPPYQTSTSIGSEFPCTYLPVFIKFCLTVALGNWYSKYFHWYCRYKFFCASIATKVVINNRKIGILFDIIITTISFSDLKTPFRLLKKFVELVRLSNLFELRCLIHIFLVLFFLSLSWNVGLHVAVSNSVNYSQSFVCTSGTHF